jgi:hypothetical protein
MELLKLLLVVVAILVVFTMIMYGMGIYSIK